MIKTVEIKVLPEFIKDEQKIQSILFSKIKYPKNRINYFELKRKSIDARKKPVYVLRYEVFIDEFPPKEDSPSYSLLPSESKHAIIIGAGPAGYFAALELIKNKIKPIILERGKDVQSRRRDLRAIQQFGEVNPHSNYCFGEGGAGTYSDGKLYTRSLKRGNYLGVLKVLVEHGANPEILVDAHPHIGSNKLPKIIQSIRQFIEEYGGEVLFDHFVTDLVIMQGKVIGVRLDNGRELTTNALILATGHSARDIYYMLDKNGISLEAKDFALGVRIEHPQHIIDKMQYGQEPRHENLPAASYRIACQVDQKGVFSFCMCPGGLIVPTATSPGELVVNGMSLSRRDSPFSNSGFVTAIDQSDLKQSVDNPIFIGLKFQEKLEQKFFRIGDGTQAAPAQRMTDFVHKRISSDLNDTSYIPGIYPAPLHELLPYNIFSRLRKGILQFKNKLRYYYTEEANLIGLESRTSSPIRIPRNKITLMHDEVEGLFPCGEGAGYAGGILSAAMDGENCARKLAEYYNK